MSEKAAQHSPEASHGRMAGAANRGLLIALLAIASGWMAYRMISPPEKGGSQTGGNPLAQPTAAAGAGRARARAGAAGADAGAMLDPTLRLDLLESSRSITYTGSRRNIFLISGGASNGTPSGQGTNGAGAVRPGGQGAGNPAPAVQQPAPPPVAPPVVIPLKFYGVAERSGGSSPKALLTSGESILIAQVGQTVAQHFRILRIGTSKLELEDMRDHTNHSIPLEDGSPAAGAAGPAGLPAKDE